MRLRAKLLYKFLILLAACLIIVIIFLQQINKKDEFITLLSAITDRRDVDVVHNADSPPPLDTNKESLSAEKPVAAKLLNLTAFNYLIENKICENYKKELMALLVVTSYAGHDEVRAAHRQAVPQKKLSEMGMQRVFLLATIPEQEHFITQSQLNNEQEKFEDLLQGNFVESYRNLSYKHIMGLQWASSNECKKAKFIIKLDDDIVYDIFHLKRYLESLELLNGTLVNSSELLAGYIFDSRKVIRNQANKWYVTHQEYPQDQYPSYLSGWLYITNPKTAARLVRQALGQPIFWIDDTWVTGVLREHLQIPLQRLNSWFSANAEFLNCCVRDLKQNSWECEYYAGPNGGDAKLLIEFLHNVEKCYYDECSKRTITQSLKQTCVAEYKKILPDHGNGEIKSVKLGR